MITLQNGSWRSLAMLDGVSVEALKGVEQFQLTPMNDGRVQVERHQPGLSVEIVIGKDGFIESVGVIRS